MKALSLFSGGLDSTLAIKLMQMQNIEVIALNFVSYFFGGKNGQLEKIAAELGAHLVYVDFKEAHRKMMLNPKSGFGKNMNPCIDCHALMIKTAGELMKEYQAAFIVTGEVKGQRPMSQIKIALRRVEKLSGLEGYVVRPLSGQVLPPTIPETSGWIKRSLMESIEGRGRKRQIQLASQLSINDYPSPAGGCRLTDPHYSKRLKWIYEDHLFNQPELFELIRFGRFFRLSKGKYIFTGRNDCPGKHRRGGRRGRPRHSVAAVDGDGIHGHRERDPAWRLHRGDRVESGSRTRAHRLRLQHVGYGRPGAAT
ncbi:MAG: hypothetical protein MJB14_03045, partial [Spirochaetes bacterium]|nr:hypothetical protein [Spirochaetota bacterium]